jgi:hypothetical protein
MKCPFKKIFKTCDIYKNKKCELALTLDTASGPVTRCAIYWIGIDLADFKHKMKGILPLLEELRNIVYARK